MEVVNVVPHVPGLPTETFGAAGSPHIAVPARAGSSVTLFVPMTYAYTSAGNSFDFYVGLQAIRLYADPGTLVSVTAASPGGATGTLFVAVSGY